MITPTAEYLRFDDVASACLALANREGAVPIGGGTILVPELVRRERAVSAIVELQGLGLDSITASPQGLEIGSLATYSSVAQSSAIARHAGLLTLMAKGITGGAQIRNQGTLGGSACRAIPSSDVPATLATLSATMRIQGPAGGRDVDVMQFFRGAGATSLEPGEILTAISIPHLPPGSGHGYMKFKLSESSWPIITAGAVTSTHGEGARETNAVIGVGGLYATPVKIELRLGNGNDLPSARDLDALLAQRGAGGLWSDELADSTFRVRIAGVIARRALGAALSSSVSKGKEA